jgi:hypothetical protein
VLFGLICLTETELKDSDDKTKEAKRAEQTLAKALSSEDKLESVKIRTLFDVEEFFRVDKPYLSLTDYSLEQSPCFHIIGSKSKGGSYSVSLQITPKNCKH